MIIRNDFDSFLIPSVCFYQLFSLAIMRLSIISLMLATISLVAAQGGGGGGGGGGNQQGGQQVQTGQYNPQGQPNNGGQNVQGGGGAGAAVAGGAGAAGAAVAGGVNGAMNGVTNIGLFIDSLPKCFKKCTENSYLATSVGCAGITDINCICSKPQFVDAVSLLY